MGYDDGMVRRSLWPGSGVIWLDNVNCTGQEDHLQNCPHLPWGEHYCDHTQDVAIRCVDTPRLSAPSTSATITSEKISSAVSVTTSSTTDGVTLESTGNNSVITVGLLYLGVCWDRWGSAKPFLPTKLSAI